MEQQEWQARLDAMRAEHRALDFTIAELIEHSDDQLTLARHKKRKLALKDSISRLEALLIPDIIA